MRLRCKLPVTLCLLLAVALSLLGLAPAGAQANGLTALKKATVQLSMEPVVLMDVSRASVAASGKNYKLSSYTWYDGNGSVVTTAFNKGLYRLEIRLKPDDGYAFVDGAPGYINNKNDGVSTSLAANGDLILSKTYSAVIWQPVVYHHPGAEKVELGGWCSFVVSGDYIGSYEWMARALDGHEYTMPELMGFYEDMEIKGYDTDKLLLYNIPGAMNGWGIFCRLWSVDQLSFRNSNPALLTVISDEPLPTPEATPEPTPAPAEEPETAEEPAEEAAPAEEAGEEPTEEAAEEPIPEETWTYDLRTHWHAAKNSDVLLDQSLHDMVWTETKAPSRDGPGEEEGVCSVCGYKTVREIPFDEQEAEQQDHNLFLIILAALAGLLGLSIIILIVQAIRRFIRRR